MKELNKKARGEIRNTILVIYKRTSKQWRDRRSTWRINRGI